MRRLNFISVILTLLPILAHADTIYTVNMWSDFTAKNSCSFNCTETIAASFQYDWGGYVSLPNGSQQAISFIVPGSFSVRANGFLGALSSTGNINSYWIPLLDSAGDEIDIQGSDIFFLANPLRMTIYACQSEPCQSNFGPVAPVASYIPQSSGSVTINVPEPSSLPLLLVSGSIIGSLVYRGKSHKKQLPA